MTPDRDRQADTRALETLRMHGEREGALLDSYGRLVEETSDEGVRYLGRLIIEDEERHHQVIGEVANRIASRVEGAKIEPSTPALSPRVDHALLEATRHLIALEKQDAKELRMLQRELRDSPPSSLLPLLVKLMLHDTAKHIEILRFIRSYTG